jgi:hypothetical protein
VKERNKKERKSVCVRKDQEGKKWDCERKEQKRKKKGLCKKGPEGKD